MKEIGGGEVFRSKKSTDQIARIKLSDFIRTTLGARVDIGRYVPEAQITRVTRRNKERERCPLPAD